MKQNPPLQKSILVVEDDESMHRFLHDILVESGFQVLRARNGDEGMAHYRAHQPDLVLTDLVMPHRSGIELIVLIRSEDKLTPIVAMTSSSPFTRANATYAGANAFLKKPFTPDALLAQIKELLSSHSLQ